MFIYYTICSCWATLSEWHAAPLTVNNGYSPPVSPAQWSRAHRCWRWTVTWRMTDMWWCRMMRICWGRPDTTSPSPRWICRWENRPHRTEGWVKGHVETAGPLCQTVSFCPGGGFLRDFFSPPHWHGSCWLSRGYIYTLYIQCNCKMSNNCKQIQIFS